MIKIYHLNNSRSQRIVWLMEELELPYDIVFQQRDPVFGPKDQRKVHPLGKWPTIEDDGRVIAESGAIIEYIIARHGGGRLAPPVEHEDWPRYIEWMHYAEGSMTMPIGLTMLPMIFGEVSPGFAAYGEQLRQLHYDYLESVLAAQPFMLGSYFSAADIMMTFQFQLSQAVGMLGNYPAQRDYIARMEARPAYRRVVQKAGALDFKFG